MNSFTEENNNIIIQTIPITSNHIEEKYGDKDELHKLLTEWNMSDLLHYFIEQQLYVGVMRHLDNDLAISIMSKSNLSGGVQAQFLYHWSKWLNDKPNVNVDSVIIPLRSGDTKTTLNLETVLNSNPYGQSVLQHYRNESSLNENIRKLLCESIVHFCIDKGHSLSVKDSENLAKQIVETFPTEEMAYYHVTRQNAAPLGKLYSKYRNWKSTINKKTKVFKEVPKCTQPSTQEEEGHVRVLRHEFNILAFEDMLSHWNGCFEYRQNTLKELCDPNSKKQLLDLWPMYNDPVGFRLIINDFDRIYGERNELLDSFDDFSDLMTQKIFPENESKFKGEDDQKLWDFVQKNNCIDYNTKFLIILTLLHSLLPPSRIKSKTSNKGNKFYSIMESKRSFITFSPTEESYKEKLDTKIVSEGSVAPYITVIGDIYKPQSFFCDFDNIKYKVFSITKAIDICFKAYHVFSIKYSEASSHMWDFLNIQFYKIDGHHVNPITHMLYKKIQEIQNNRQNQT